MKVHLAKPLNFWHSDFCELVWLYMHIYCSRGQSKLKTFMRILTPISFSSCALKLVSLV